MENNIKRGELNLLLTFFLFLCIIGNISLLLVSFLEFLEKASNDSFRHFIWQTICSSIIVASAVGVLLKKKWGVYLLFGWGAVVMLSEIIIPDFFPQNALIHDFIICVFWGGLFFLKKDGKTAWSVLLNKQKREKNDNEDKTALEEIPIESNSTSGINGVQDKSVPDIIQVLDKLYLRI